MHKTKRHLSINCKILQALIFSEMQIKPEQNLPFHIYQILARYYKLCHAWFVSLFVLFKTTYSDLFYTVSNNKIRLISWIIATRTAILGFATRTNEAAGAPRQDSWNPGIGLKKLKNTK